MGATGDDWDSAAQVDAAAASGPAAERRSPLRRRSRGAASLSTPVILCLVQGVDLLIFLLAGVLAGQMVPGRRNALPGEAMLMLLAGCCAGLVTVWGLRRGGAYTAEALRSVGMQLRVMAGAGMLGLGSLVVCLFFLSGNGPHVRLLPVAWMMLGGGLFVAFRSVMALRMRRWMDSGQLARRVAVVGRGEFSRKFIERLREEPRAYTFVGLYDDRRVERAEARLDEAVRGTVAELLERSRQERIDVIVVALPLEAVARIQKILDELRSAVADVCLTTGLAGLHFTSSKVSAVGANPVILISERPFKDWSAVSKRAFDVSLAVMLMVALAPVLGLVALLIRLDSRGPVLFRQPRRGFNHQMFACFKFRTMRVEMTDLLAERQTTRDDPRVTRVGRWLRRSSLDELPQLVNVLRGEMSLVGPRPHAPNTKAADRLFEDVVSQYATRHRVKPGITGWAQVNGWRGETRTVEQIEQRVACDLSYIERWSLLFDVRILLMTVFRGLFAANAF